MTTSELKLKIFRQVDSLDKSRLEDFYGVLTNFINGQKQIDDWIELTEDQKRGLCDAIDEIDAGKGIPHDEVISKFRKKYSHA